MNKFTACLKNSVRGKRERESCVSVWAENGTKELSWMHRKEKIKLGKIPQLAPCNKQGWGSEGAAHQWCDWEGIRPCFPGRLHRQEFINQTFFANFGTWIRVLPKTVNSWQSPCPGSFSSHQTQICFSHLCLAGSSGLVLVNTYIFGKKKPLSS